MMPSWAIVLIAIGSVASAILAIWALMERLSKKFYKIVDDQIERSLSNYEELQEQKFLRLIEKIALEFNHKVDCLAEDFNEYMHSQEIRQAKEDEQSKVVKASLIAIYKQEIRDIYYTLRDVGTISDQDKEYIDRIYPLYYALGGNSDITQKIGEIQRVIERRTQEAFDKALEESQINNKK